METVERMMGLLQDVKESGLTFVEYVRTKEQEIERLQADLDEIKRLSEFSEKFAVVTPSGRRKRRDAGKTRKPRTAEPVLDGGELPTTEA